MAKLEGTQKERAIRLESQLEIAVEKSDLTSAKKIVNELEDIYVRFKQSNASGIAKNKLMQIAIDAGEYSFAEGGLITLRKRYSTKTRMHLEASALLAISYLRTRQLSKAEPIIAEVLQNKSVIKSESKRSQFYKSIIQRFDEEATLYAIKGEVAEKVDINEIIEKAQIESGKSEQQLYVEIGISTPENAKKVLFRIDNFSKNLLPTGERLKLPAPKQELEDDKIGRTVFFSMKRIVYRSLCDSNSDIYKMWFNKGLGVVNKAALITSISETFIKRGIGLKALIVSLVALVIKFGIELFCERFKPKGLMDLR